MEPESTPRVKKSSIVVTLQNKSGLHFRPAAEFVTLAKKFRSDIRVAYHDKEVDGKNATELLSLDAWEGAFLQITATGDDASAMSKALRDLVDRQFVHMEAAS